MAFWGEDSKGTTFIALSLNSKSWFLCILIICKYTCMSLIVALMAAIDYFKISSIIRELVINGDISMIQNM